MNIYAVLGGQIPRAVGKWCVKKANTLSGHNDWDRKLPNHTTTPLGFLASSFLKPFGTIVIGMSYIDPRDYDNPSIPVVTAVLGGLTAIAVGIAAGVAMAPTVGFFGAIALGLAAPIVSYPVIHIASIATLAGSIGFLNAAFVGNIGCLVIAAKSVLAGRQSQQPVPAPAQPPHL